MPKRHTLPVGDLRTAVLTVIRNKHPIGLTEDQVVEELAQTAGSTFDPEAVPHALDELVVLGTLDWEDVLDLSRPLSYRLRMQRGGLA